MKRSAVLAGAFIQIRRCRRPARAVALHQRGPSTEVAMQPKWIALGLFAAGLASLLIGASLPYLKHLAVGLISVLA